MGPQYQATIDSYAASPQAAQSAGNQTLGKSLEQSPVHDGFGTRSSMYDNGMDVSSRPAPTVDPPQPQNQPSSAGIHPSWAQQLGRKKGGRAKRMDGGNLSSLPGYVSPAMARLTVGPPRVGPIPGSEGGFQQIPQSPTPTAYTPGPANNPPLPPLTPPDRAAGLAAFNKPGPAEGFAAVPLSQFGSMYNQPNSMMMTGDTLARFGNMPSNLLPMPVQIARRNMEQQAAAEEAAIKQQEAWRASQAKSTLPAEVLQSLPRGQEPFAPRYRSTATNLPEHYPDYNALMPGVYADQPGMMDPFVAGYLSRIGAAQNIYGNIAKQNYAASQEQQKQYQEALDALTKSGEQKMSEAEILKKQQDEAAAAAEAERQRQLLLFILMSQR
jgi:hypothetical protein